jgi:hypothetical protein
MNALDVLKYGNLTVLRAVDGLPDAEWETPDVCGVWSVKNIVAHLASYELLLLDVLTSFGGGSTPTLDLILAAGDDFNDTQVDQRRRKSPSDTLAEYTSVQEEVMLLAGQIPSETFRTAGMLPWYGMEYSLDDFIVYTSYGHKREHCSQIAVFRDRIAQ